MPVPAQAGMEGADWRPPHTHTKHTLCVNVMNTEGERVGGVGERQARGLREMGTRGWATYGVTLCMTPDGGRDTNTALRCTHTRGAQGDMRAKGAGAQLRRNHDGRKDTDVGGAHAHRSALSVTARVLVLLSYVREAGCVRSRAGGGEGGSSDRDMSPNALTSANHQGCQPVTQPHHASARAQHKHSLPPCIALTRAPPGISPSGPPLPRHGAGPISAPAAVGKQPRRTHHTRVTRKHPLSARVGQRPLRRCLCCSAGRDRAVATFPPPSRQRCDGAA